MRDIRIRCYSRRTEKMYYPGEYRIKFNRDQKKYVMLFVHPEDQYEKKNSTILMLSTGLRDKNDVEIYDGDILRGGPYEHNVDTISVVEYQYGCFGYYSRPGFCSFYKIAASNFEVIGNIHEHKNLL